MLNKKQKLKEYKVIFKPILIKAKSEEDAWKVFDKKQDYFPEAILITEA